MVGAEYLTAAGGPGSVGGYYYEVEVLHAEGALCVGFAGTNLGTQCTCVGDDACSWGYYARDGDGGHGCGGSELVHRRRPLDRRPMQAEQPSQLSVCTTVHL